MGCSGTDPLNYFNLRQTPRIAGRGTKRTVVTCFGQRSSPFPPSPPPPSEETDVKASLGMLHLFSERVKF